MTMPIGQSSRNPLHDYRDYPLSARLNPPPKNQKKSRGATPPLICESTVPSIGAAQSLQPMRLPYGVPPLGNSKHHRPNTQNPQKNTHTQTRTVMDFLFFLDGTCIVLTASVLRIKPTTKGACFATDCGHAGSCVSRWSQYSQRGCTYRWCEGIGQGRVQFVGAFHWGMPSRTRAISSTSASDGATPTVVPFMRPAAVKAESGTVVVLLGPE